MSSKKLVGKLLCKVGIHKWIGLGQNMLMTDHVSQCKRCKLGKHIVGYAGVIQYTPEAMSEAWAKGKISNEEAHIEIYGKRINEIPVGARLV